MVPKLVAEDIPLLFSLLSDVFPGVQYHRGEMTALREELKKVCQEMYLTYGDGEEVGGMWVEKVSGAVGLAGASQTRLSPRGHGAGWNLTDGPPRGCGASWSLTDAPPRGCGAGWSLTDPLAPQGPWH